MIDILFQQVSLHEKGIKKIDINSFKKLFFEIVDDFSQSYEKCRNDIPDFLNIFEVNKEEGISLLVFIFMQKYNEVISKKNIAKIDINPLKQDVNKEETEDFKKLLYKLYSDGSPIRISEIINFVDDNYSENQKTKFSSLILDTLQSTSSKHQISSSDLENYSTLLVIQRSLLHQNVLINAFHLINCGLVLDKAVMSEFNQTARDIAEELLLTSYNDSLQELGYFNSFRTYANLNSIATALVYGIVSMHLALKKDKITDIYLKEIIWVSLKLFRNLGFDNIVEEIFQNIPNTILFDSYTKRAITHTYFTNLLKKSDPKLPSLVLDFFQEYREEVFNGGEHDALPWLNTLYHIKRFYPKADFSRSGLGFYLEVLEQIVSKESIKLLKDIVDGNSNELKNKLKESLYKLSATRNSSDYANDNTLAIQIASRLTPDAVKNNDFEALLLAMLVKTDYSFVFEPKDSSTLMKLEIENFDEEKFKEFFDDYPTIVEKIKQYHEIGIVWIISSEEKCFYMHFNDDFKADSLLSWDYDSYRKLIKSNYFSSFSFQETKKSRGTIIEVFPEELLEESDNLKKDFSFIKFDFPNKKEILAILDMSIAEFPHNLLQNEKGNFQYLETPICNILSLEWFLNHHKSKLKKNFEKSIWIPTEGGDFTINLLYSGLENTLNEFSFQTNTDLNVKEPINSDINIICSHGDENISLTQMIFPNENPLFNLSSVVGKGKILIFFVCHSGSVKKTPFQNSISSLVKNYINKGYSAVIAPFWALHVNIPPIWLPVFLECLERGMNVNSSVHIANLEVYNKYPHLAAWACLHLYGDGTLIT
ncbi:hypothetical protein [Chryseobacterium nepalense]|uniref:hypothetical protein n=1 Tax=Chryseobacterium nepalense TaxID=1854498 RepID=UPI002E0711E4|nr:hypothetical protein [Chryseobacterium nepalense]